MTEPDELYTLRAQFWLGHYNLAIEEAKSVVRRPMSPNLKLEREVFLLRAQLALGQFDKVIAAAQEAGSDRPDLQALGLAAQYHSAGSPEAKEPIVDQLRSLTGGSSSSPSAQLTAAQIFLDAGLTRDALQCVHAGNTMEHLSLCLQVYLKIDRLDLAQQQLRQLKQTDEDAVLTQLGSIYCSLATGSSVAGDALHSVSMLMEQYGPSPFLVNLMACSLMLQGNYGDAEQRLQECLQEFPDNVIADTLINLVVCCQHQQKETAPYLAQMETRHPRHPFCEGVERVQAAFAREVGKYKI